MKNILLLFLFSFIACKNDNSEKNKNSDITSNVIKDSCASLTPDGQAACTKKDVIPNKTCVWEYDECYEFAQWIENFKADKKSFVSNIPNSSSINISTDEALGTDHGETPDFSFLCDMDAQTNPTSIINATNSVSVNFDDNKVNIVLDCQRIVGANNVTYSFDYEIKPAGNDLLIRLKSDKNLNKLDFFTKADWFYSSAKESFYGIIQLGKLGYSYNSVNLKNESDFDKAFAYARAKAKGNGYEISNNVGAISFYFSKKNN